MDHELPPNKVCRKCGAENLATASHCLECHAALGSVFGPREEVLWIDGKSAASWLSTPRRGPAWRGFFRVMSVLGLTASAAALYPTVEGKGIAAVVTFIAAASLAVVSALSADSSTPGSRGPNAGWAMVDDLLRGIGCLFAALAAIVISLFAFFLALCYCGSR